MSAAITLRCGCQRRSNGFISLCGRHLTTAWEAAKQEDIERRAASVPPLSWVDPKPDGPSWPDNEPITPSGEESDD